MMPSIVQIGYNFTNLEKAVPNSKDFFYVQVGEVVQSNIFLTFQFKETFFKSTKYQKIIKIFGFIF